MKNKLIPYTVISLLPLTSHSRTYSPPQEDPYTVSKFCLVKKEIPDDIKFQFISDTSASMISASGPLIINRDINPPLPFPKNTPPNLMPVALMQKGKMYTATTNGFTDSGLTGNPLAIGYSEMVSLDFNFKQIPLVVNIEPITDKEIQTYISVPMKYYYGDKVQETTLRVYSKPSDKMNDYYTILKVESEKPLPSGFTITGSEHGSFEKSKRSSLYNAMNFSYSGSVPITFFKEFTLPVVDRHLLLENRFPVYIYDKGKCFELAAENRSVLPRDKGKKNYDDLYKAQSAFVNAAKGIEEDKQEYLRMIKERDLYEAFPLSHIFDGNGRSEEKCDLTFDFFQTFFWKEEYEKRKEVSYLDYKTPAPSKISEVQIPEESFRKIDIGLNGKNYKFTLLKRHFLNENWKPLKEINAESSECSPFCPDIFVKTKINYFSNAKITYPTSSYKTEDLICGMPGERDRPYHPNKFTDEDEMYY